MSPDLIGILLGLLFVIPTIYFIRKRHFDNLAWPLFLISLPIWYMAFGLLAMDQTAILNELIYGLPYFAIGLIAWKLKHPLTLVIVAVGWLSHGLYDYYHDMFFINPGVFSWYPAFCAVIDILVGCYLLIEYRRLVHQWTETS